jgi:hypothetical protein
MNEAHFTAADQRTSPRWAFDSGVSVLDDWPKRRAKANQTSGASRTYVVCEEQRVVGYHTLAAGAVAIETASARLRRNMPASQSGRTCRLTIFL